MAELAAELGISDRIIASNDAKRRVFIGRDGKLIGSYGSTTRPDEKDFVATIEKALAAQ